MKRLNNAFGIGINFSTFIAQLSKVINASKEYTGDARLSFEKNCDKIFESD